MDELSESHNSDNGIDNHIIFAPIRERLIELRDPNFDEMIVDRDPASNKWRVDRVRDKIAYSKEPKRINQTINELIVEIEKMLNDPEQIKGSMRKDSDFMISTDYIQEKNDETREIYLYELDFYQTSLEQLQESNSFKGVKYKWTGHQIQLIELLFALTEQGYLVAEGKERIENFPDLVFDFFHILGVVSKKTAKDVYDSRTDILYPPLKPGKPLLNQANF